MVSYWASVAQPINFQVHVKEHVMDAWSVEALHEACLIMNLFYYLHSLCILGDDLVISIFFNFLQNSIYVITLRFLVTYAWVLISLIKTHCILILTLLRKVV
jgi:hypothetical protein